MEWLELIHRLSMREVGRGQSLLRQLQDPEVALLVREASRLLREAAPADRMSGIQGDDCRALFILLVAHGNGENVRLLLAAFSARVQKSLLASENYRALTIAAGLGHSEVAAILIQVARQGYFLSPMLAQEDPMHSRDRHPYYAFRLAAKSGHASVVRLFVQEVPEEDRLPMIRTKHYEAFHSSVKLGFVNIARINLESLPSFQRQNLLLTWNSEAVYRAAERGDVDMVALLVHTARGERCLTAMLEALSRWSRRATYNACCIAAEKGHIAVVRMLMQALPTAKHKAAMAKEAFAQAAINGNADICDLLLAELSLDARQQLIRAGNYSGDYWVFRAAVAHGFASVVAICLREAHPDDKQKMISGKFSVACSRSNWAVSALLWHHSSDATRSLLQNTYHQYTRYGELLLSLWAVSLNFRYMRTIEGMKLDKIAYFPKPLEDTIAQCGQITSLKRHQVVQLLGSAQRHLFAPLGNTRPLTG
jgi:hypothetical protein